MIELEALQLALSKEQEAISIYQKLMDDYPVLKGLFNFLSNEEQKHKALIEKKIVELYK